MSKRFLTVGFVVAFALFIAVTYGGVVSATHAWGNYHWARPSTSEPVALTIGDNVSSSWDVHLAKAIEEWDKSDVLSLTAVAGATSPRRCKPATGKIEVCSDTYGNNGWLGLAGISVSGDHINYAYAKMNDSYYVSGGKYDTPEWRAFVMCQEVGHDFGLGHQDETFDNDNLNSCMDYTSNPATNQWPNRHDYDQLADIYDHSDGGSSDGGGSCKGPAWKCAGGQTAPPAFDMDLSEIGQWGKLLWTSQDGGQSTFVQDFGNGHRVYTHVTWTLEVAEQLRGRR